MPGCYQGTTPGMGNRLSLPEKEDIYPIINHSSILPAPDTHYCPCVKLYASHISFMHFMSMQQC